MLGFGDAPVFQEPETALLHAAEASGPNEAAAAAAAAAAVRDDSPPPPPPPPPPDDAFGDNTEADGGAETFPTKKRMASVQEEFDDYVQTTHTTHHPPRLPPRQHQQSLEQQEEDEEAETAEKAEKPAMNHETASAVLAWGVSVAAETPGTVTAAKQVIERKLSSQPHKRSQSESSNSSCFPSTHSHSQPPSPQHKHRVHHMHRVDSEAPNSNSDVPSWDDDDDADTDDYVGIAAPAARGGVAKYLDALPSAVDGHALLCETVHSQHSQQHQQHQQHHHSPAPPPLPPRTNIHFHSMPERPNVLSAQGKHQAPLYTCRCPNHLSAHPTIFFFLIMMSLILYLYRDG